MPKSFLILLILLTNLYTNAQNWIYFDLGNTIVNTRDSAGIKYFNGSLEYLRALQKMNYHIGIISNIPETFGQSHEEKLATLKDYIQTRWIDQNEMDWDIFEDILLPLNNSQLKPAEVLYYRAIEKSDFCPIAYVSENLSEVLKAQELGMAGHLFLEDDQVDFDKLYIPLDEIKSYIKEKSKITPPSNHPGCPTDTENL